MCLKTGFGLVTDTVEPRGELRGPSPVAENLTYGHLTAASISGSSLH